MKIVHATYGVGVLPLSTEILAQAQEFKLIWVMRDY
jgi:hypothetical protein